MGGLVRCIMILTPGVRKRNSQIKKWPVEIFALSGRRQSPCRQVDFHVAVSDALAKQVAQPLRPHQGRRWSMVMASTRTMGMTSVVLVDEGFVPVASSS